MPIVVRFRLVFDVAMKGFEVARRFRTALQTQLSPFYGAFYGFESPWLSTPNYLSSNLIAVRY